MDTVIDNSECSLNAEEYRSHLKMVVTELQAELREEILESCNIAADGGTLVPGQKYDIPATRWHQLIQPLMLVR